MQARYLKANKGEDGPARLAFVDSETVPVTETTGAKRTWHMLQCWHASGGRFRGGKFVGRSEGSDVTQESFWLWVEGLLSPRETTWLFAHNWGFDCESLGWRHQLNTGAYLLEVSEEVNGDVLAASGRKSPFHGLWVDEGPPAICSVMHRSGSRLTILDSANWLPESLEKIGLSIGLKKVPLPLPTDPLPKHQARCAQDVKILERAMLCVLGTIKLHKMGNLKLTAAAQALALYRHRLMPNKLVLHRRPEVAALERASYYGGRIELYFKGKVEAHHATDWIVGDDDPPSTLPPPHGPVYELDASGLYPAVMAEGSFPTRLVEYWDGEAHGPRDVAVLGGHCIADVQVESPYWPWPQRAAGSVYWCTGTFRTTLAGPELASALQLGVVKKCFRFAKYETARHLRDFANECWAKRMAAEQSQPPRSLEAKLWKHIVNALHGKFAQRTPAWEVCDADNMGIQWGKVDGERGCSDGFPGVDPIPEHAVWNDERKEWRWWERRRVLAGVVEREVEREDSEHAFVAVAAFVASAAREKVRTWMEIAGPYNVLCCHTDSIVVTKEGYDKLQSAGMIRDRDLGFLRLVREADNAELWACGFYRIGDYHAHSGIGMKARQMEDGTWLWEQFEPLSQAAWNDPGPGVLVRWKRRSQPTQYTKGVVDKTGWIAPHPRMEIIPPDGCDVRSCAR